MQTGALIVAAGKSSRMGDFKPMLQLGSISIAQRVINNFRQAGISKENCVKIAKFYLIVICNIVKKHDRMNIYIMMWTGELFHG